MASVIAPTAPGQREGVMAELKMVAKALQAATQRNSSKSAPVTANSCKFPSPTPYFLQNLCQIDVNIRLFGGNFV